MSLNCGSNGSELLTHCYEVFVIYLINKIDCLFAAGNVWAHDSFQAMNFFPKILILHYRKRCIDVFDMGTVLWLTYDSFEPYLAADALLSHITLRAKCIGTFKQISKKQIFLLEFIWHVCYASASKNFKPSSWVEEDGKGTENPHDFIGPYIFHEMIFLRESCRRKCSTSNRRISLHESTKMPVSTRNGSNDDLLATEFVASLETLFEL